MIEKTFNQLLAASISAINSATFTPKLVAFINHIVNFDCAVITGLRGNKHPIYLYDSIKESRDLLFERYLTASFRDDPFYQMILSNKKQGVHSLKDIINNKAKISSTDYSHFYLQTGWQDELCLVIEIEPERWVIIYLGKIKKDHVFTREDINTLKSHFCLIQSLCQQHWLQAEFLLAESLLQPALHTEKKRELIKRALCTFGQHLLTKREKQIVTLIIQGLDSQEIATQLGVSEGTVKNHRKRIYAKLHVASLSELFQLFLNHLITQ